jgi:hypothetical protein
MPSSKLVTLTLREPKGKNLLFFTVVPSDVGVSLLAE